MEKEQKGSNFKAKKVPANLNTSKTLHDITLKGNLSMTKTISDKKNRCPIKLNRLLKGQTFHKENNKESTVNT